MRQAASLAVLLALLAGCGQKGPLFLPEDTQAAERYGHQATASPDPESREKG
ncbi:lipoprotein [Halomonas campisalis]|uniref:Lipoprotein n=1 Tax=Billgrantia campisalis TaxID=74661 RepID=A0ABS9P610_9GAMM|nr:lipoprotein [Halomonas campisalis]MCG6656550.1 lipoprotein [Halomonas campisalis]MDR5861736.1 lipoprotein [Halomonas campisalis]